MPGTPLTILTRATPLRRLIDTRDGANNNFDLIRLIAASLVLISHAFPLSGTATPEPLSAWTGGQATFGGVAVCIFFFISGFLVSRSLERRRSLIAFATARIMRIFPGLAVVIALSALVLGPLTTSLDLTTYFAHRGFSGYFRNMLLQMHYTLPGVFTNNAMQGVNGSLWTLSFEVVMYTALPLVLWVGLFVSRGLLLAGFLALVCAQQFWIKTPADGLSAYYYIHLGQFFLAGIIAYVYRDAIRINTPAALICLGAVIASASLGGFCATRLIAGSYFLLWLAYDAPKIPDPITPFGDLSYGVYIYAFPMQQWMAHSFAAGRTWDGNIALALPLTLLCAALSWQFVEAPAMRARGSIAALLIGRRKRPRTA
ncbi:MULTISPECIES: acyltransferase [Rhodomicrobium]|uniref:acyltransferase family protein n=1 Tax=Rhodomicrobium TaxID=1068 RepID=UPI000B4BB4A7|nr:MULTISPECIES: acyltransferase [Rhodomicrobium]